MGQCSKCGAISQGAVAFCTQCGSAIQAPTNTSFAGRPVISMDPRKQGQVSENPGGPVTSAQQFPTSQQQILNSQSSQYQSSPITPQASSPGSNTNKIIIGALGAILAIVAVVLLLGQRDSKAPDVAPTSQQSEQTEITTSYDYSSDSYDDYPADFRLAFLSECSQGAPYESCVCALENMESMYSIERVEFFYDSGEDLSWFYDQVISGCI